MQEGIVLGGVVVNALLCIHMICRGHNSHNRYKNTIQQAYVSLFRYINS